MVEKVPVGDEPLPISRSTNPKALVVFVCFSLYTEVPAAEPCKMLIRNDTFFETSALPELSRATAWYLKAYGVCAVAVIAITTNIKNDAKDFIDSILGC